MDLLIASLILFAAVVKMMNPKPMTRGSAGEMTTAASPVPRERMMVVSVPAHGQPDTKWFVVFGEHRSRSILLTGNRSPWSRSDN